MSGSGESKKVGSAQPDWMNVSPVFIVGCPRSGTTLLRLMLTAHPNISISSEGAHIYHIAREFSSYADVSDVERSMRALHQDLQPWLEKVKFLGTPTLDELLDWVRRFGVTLRSLITFYGTWEARVLGKKRLIWWGDNAPYHVHHVPLFNALFPGSRFLVMIRDPRDTCASGKEDLPWGRGARNFENRVTAWEKSLLHGLLAGLILGPERVKYVRYEELVSMPREVLHDISNFLGVEYTDEMLSYYQSAAAVAIAELDHHKNVVRPVFATSVGKYRQILTKKEVDLIEQKLFTPMFQFRYLSYEEYRRALYRKTEMDPDAE